MVDDARGQYEAIASELTAVGAATAGQMFGMPTLKTRGKAFAGLYQGAMVFKLDVEARERALGLAGAHRFDPSGRGRPMKEWVVVPAEHAGEWSGLADNALEFVIGAA